MVTRLRYKKLTDGNLVTTNPVVAGTEVLTVTLNPERLAYSIVNNSNGIVIESGEAVSLQMLKIKVKRTLRGRGVVFGDEVRSKDQLQ